MSKKSKHIPRKGAKTKNIIKCILKSIDERSSLTWQMCGEDFDEKTYYKILNVLVDSGIIVVIDNSKPVVDTSDFIIANYEASKFYTDSSFVKCLARIEKDLVPLLNVTAATMNFLVSTKNI